MAQLSSLSFSLDTRMTISRLNEWLQRISVVYLRNWSIGSIHESNLARAISGMAPSLTRLEQLSLNLRAPRGRVSDFWRAAEGMMTALPPLKALWLTGYRYGRFLNKTFAHHGNALQILRLDARSIDQELIPHRRLDDHFTAKQLAKFAKRCPVLREFHLTIRCRQGRAPETEIHKTLGLFPGLVSLYIDLDYFPAKDDINKMDGLDGRPRDLSPDGFVAYYRGHVALKSIHELSGIFINSLIDAQLAKNIRDTVISAQSTPRLQTVHLFPFIDKEPNFFQNDVKNWLQQLMRSWPVTSTGCHGSNSLFVEKLAQEPHLFTSRYGNRKSPHAPNGFFRNFFRWLWPAIGFEAKGWSSAPLEDTE